MTNHVHLLMTAHQKYGVSKLMQALGRKYVQYFNFEYNRTGTLWEGRFRSCLVESENYLLECYRYIELNPVRANMVELPTEYKWSSHTTNAHGLPSKLITPHPVYKRLGKTDLDRQVAYRLFFSRRIDQSLIEELRLSTQKGMVIGSDALKKQLAELHGGRVDNLRIGRPKKRALTPFI